MHQTGFGEFTASANYSYIDDYATSDTFDPLAYAQGYGLWNFDFGLTEIAGTRAEVSLFVQNAFDKEYLLPRQHLFQISRVDSPGEPRAYGVRVRYRFGAH